MSGTDQHMISWVVDYLVDYGRGSLDQTLFCLDECITSTMFVSITAAFSLKLQGMSLEVLLTFTDPMARGKGK